MPKINEYEITEKVKMDEDSYTGYVLEMKGPIETEYNKVKREKLIVSYDVDGAILQQWMTNIISEGDGKKYSDSALKIWLGKMGYYDEFIKNPGLKDDAKFVDWINNTLKAEMPKVKVVVKNSNKGTENEYSTVSEVLKRL